MQPAVWQWHGESSSRCAPPFGSFSVSIDCFCGWNTQTSGGSLSLFNFGNFQRTIRDATRRLHFASLMQNVLLENECV